MRKQGTTLYAAIDRLSLVPRWLLVTGSFALVAVIGFFDWVTPLDVACSVGYMIPVFLSSTGGRRIGLGFALIATTVWELLDWQSRHGVPYSDAIVPYWNFFARLMVLGMIASLVSSLTAKLDQERGLSRTDSLTGLPNARAFHEAAATEIDRMRRTGQVLTAAYVDIDDFKAVNDSLGHGAGDDLLALTARTMTGALRGTDLVARLGGDEFALLLPGASLDDAKARLHSLHGALAAATSGFEPAVGFSIGAVTFADAPHSGEHLVAHADRVMYGVKQHGKNTVWAQNADADAYAESPAHLR